MELKVNICVEPLNGQGEHIKIASLAVEGLTKEQCALWLKYTPRDIERALLVKAAGPPVDRRNGERRGADKRVGPRDRRWLRVISGTCGFFMNRQGKTVVDKRVSGQRRFYPDGYNGRRKHGHDRRKK